MKISKGAYGNSLIRWMYADEIKPYGSYGNGSAMRVSPIGWIFDTEQAVLDEARKSAVCTHNHPEGIKGAQATAISIGGDSDTKHLRERFRKLKIVIFTFGKTGT